MSGMRNLHRIMGAAFTHYKPNLCPGCRHFEKPAPILTDGWYGVCAAKGSVLCCARVQNGRCKDYEGA